MGASLRDGLIGQVILRSLRHRRFSRHLGYRAAVPPDGLPACDAPRGDGLPAGPDRTTWKMLRSGPALSLLLLFLAAGLAAQQPGAGLTGVVRDAHSGRPLEGVEVRLEGLDLVAVTDSTGRYRLSPVPPGPQVLHAERLGYADTRVPVTMPARGVIAVNLTMAETALELKGITVTADVASRARGELGTASVISTEAVKEQTATSLAGVLQLVPGVEMQPPGLDNVQQIALRTAPTSGSASPTGAATVSELASFGTLIVLDGVPLSNNANLQSVGGNANLLFSSSAGGGVDLRSIPASTIQRVEVIRGVPSARYGDLTEGAIVVDTRAGAVQPELRGQFDARTGEGTALAGGSVGPFGTATWTFDVAQTRGNPGVSNDHAYRFSTELADRVVAGPVVGPAGERRLTVNTRGSFYELVDDRPPNAQTGPDIAFSARDATGRMTADALLRGHSGATLDWTAAVSGGRQHSFSQAPMVRGTLPFTDRLTPGLATGFYISGQYIADLNIDGAPWMLYSRLEGSADARALGLTHRLRAGLELRREWNSGAGYQFDMHRPPQVDFNGVQGFERPRSFRDIPAVATGSAYIDDRLSQSLGAGVGLNVQAGLRLDELARGSWWTSAVRDVAFEPRINLELLPARWLRLRGAWGRTAKTPSLDELYPAPQYNDVVNVNWYTPDPAERLAVLTTYVEDPTNPDLGFTLADRSELGLELGLGRSVVSLVAFHDRTRGDVSPDPQPSSLLRAHYQLTDSIIGDGRRPDIIQPASSLDTVPILIDRPANNVTVDDRGFEVTASLPELRPLRMRLELQGSWVWTRRSTTALYFGTDQNFSDFQLLPDHLRTPYWNGVTETGEQALVTYRLVHHEPEVGLVITATVQQNIRDEQRDIAAADTLSFAGYMTRDGSLVPVPASQRGLPQYADLRKQRAGTLEENLVARGDWLASLEVTKSLPLDGRLSFWAFNLFDRRGIFPAPGILARTYASMRFGLALSMPARALTPWLK